MNTTTKEATAAKEIVIRKGEVKQPWVETVGNAYPTVKTQLVTRVRLVQEYLDGQTYYTLKGEDIRRSENVNGDISTRILNLWRDGDPRRIAKWISKI